MIGNIPITIITIVSGGGGAEIFTTGIGGRTAALTRASGGVRATRFSTEIWTDTAAAAIAAPAIPAGIITRIAVVVTVIVLAIPRSTSLGAVLAAVVILTNLRRKTVAVITANGVAMAI